TVGIFVETLAQSIATQVLGRGAGESRAFVRYVNPESDAFDAGVRSFVSACQDPCAEAPVPPVRVTSIDIIETVNGSPVRDADQFLAAVDAVPTGAPVVLTGERIEQAGDGSTTSSDFIVTLTAQPLLPEVTASGDALLQAIWAERRWELAMEQH